MSDCRVCRSSIEPFIDFGRMPLANGFLQAGQFASEYFFNLGAGYCPQCTLVQLLEQPDRDRMFNERYPFFSASSSRMSEHFAAIARDLLARQLSTPDPLVVEIGSNDGTLLRHFAEAGIRHIGFEPSASVAAAAAAQSVNTLCRFFDADMARQVVTEHGPAHAVIAANALSHVADLHSVVAGIRTLLAPAGVAVIEDPYWADVVEQTAFDQIYDEHASYFTLTSVQAVFAQHDLAVIDVVPQRVHGGSLRYLIAPAGQRPAASRVADLLARERATGLHLPATFAAFRERVTANGEQLVARLQDLKRRGQRVVGYGATSKSTTVINRFGITSELVEFISDTTPAKHGTFSPGAHIAVRPHAEFAADYPEWALLFSWNHAAEVRAKEQAFAAAGGRWLGYVPAVQEW
ncbi:MAG: class I SAM-dependent methyltransferase [Acidobacteriota bacterium]|nr:class I SAM-dependent methyltransferase [Acidobacteriota bacterium]